MRQVHAQDPVTRLEDREIGRHVGLGAAVGLDVDVLGAGEEGECALLGEPLRDIDVFAAAVVPLARETLRVLVRQPAALGLEHRGRDVVLARDELDLVVLAVAFALHGRPEDGVDLGDRGHRDARGGGDGHGSAIPFCRIRSGQDVAAIGAIRADVAGSVSRGRGAAGAAGARRRIDGYLPTNRQPCGRRVSRSTRARLPDPRRVRSSGVDRPADRAVRRGPRAPPRCGRRRSRRRAGSRTTGPDASTTVDGMPPGAGPPSRIRSMSGPMSARISAAVEASGCPDTLAEVTGSGPSARASARGAGWSGTRSPIVDAPPVRAAGSSTSAAPFEHERQAARPEGRGQGLGRGGHDRQVVGLRCVGQEQDDALLGRPMFHVEQVARCLPASRGRRPGRRPCRSGGRRPPRRGAPRSRRSRPASSSGTMRAVTTAVTSGDVLAGGHGSGGHDAARRVRAASERRRDAASASAGSARTRSSSSVATPSSWSGGAT